ncbi:MAG: PASTA domain-containing protein [Chitinivibrionia bacterium]|nr:PASTA domain-containing protein [Chitinivibrionia bacterium]
MRARRSSLRLHIIGVIFAIITCILWARLIRIQVVSHAFYEKQAREQWTGKRVIEPVRGAIYDRNGRPLALSSRSYSISLNPAEAQKNSKEVIAAVARIARVGKAAVKQKLHSTSKFEYVVRKCNLTEAEAEELRGLAGVGLHPEPDRTYPFGSVANKIVGFFGVDGKGMAGMEAAFETELRGQPGWERVILDGRYRVHGYDMYPNQKPVDGNGIMLTIDTAIQEIAEIELSRGTNRFGACWGTAIVMDCATGEILALAEYPSPSSRSFSSMVDSLWTVRSVSCVYEPGSTFKLVTAAALLETGSVKPSDVFFAENGSYNMKFARISDAHPFGYLTFREGFVHSSNIVMAKATLNVSRREFYKFVRLFGFGAKTGVELKGESSGDVPPVEKWSKRSLATMSFGHEIAVTPIQMLSCFAAVANDGILMKPMIVKAILDPQGTIVREKTPVKIRNVISKQTARTLQSFCRDVVKDGTATGADISWLEVSGKTGTGQKVSPLGGYLPGKYSASFIGFIPAQNPRIACLVMLDEPDFAYRFGGLSAALIFADIARDMAISTDVFDDVPASNVVRETAGGAERAATPNFIRMNVSAAMARGKELDVAVMCDVDEGSIIAQDPDPDVPAERDRPVRVYVGVPADTSTVEAPDLLGMSLREAKKHIIGLGCTPSILGSGVVVSQVPPPGEPLESGVVQLKCAEAQPPQEEDTDSDQGKNQDQDTKKKNQKSKQTHKQTQKNKQTNKPAGKQKQTR